MSWVKAKADWERRDHGRPDYERDICESCLATVVMRRGHTCRGTEWVGNREYRCPDSHLRAVVDLRPGARVGEAWMSFDQAAPEVPMHLKPRWIACLLSPTDYDRTMGWLMSPDGDVYPGRTLEIALELAGMPAPRESTVQFHPNVSWMRRFKAVRSDSRK